MFELSGGSEGLEVLEDLEGLEELPRVLCSSGCEDASAVISVDPPVDGPSEDSSDLFPETAVDGADGVDWGPLFCAAPQPVRTSSPETAREMAIGLEIPGKADSFWGLNITIPPVLKNG
jgi:hypothetical protein